MGFAVEETRWRRRKQLIRFTAQEDSWWRRDVMVDGNMSSVASQVLNL